MLTDTLLDGIEAALSGAAGLSADDFAQAVHLWLLLAVARPAILRRRPRLWDGAKDVIAGIESGALPKPAWYDGARALE